MYKIWGEKPCNLQSNILDRHTYAHLFLSLTHTYTHTVTHYNHTKDMMVFILLFI